MASCVRSRPEILTLIKLFIGDGGQAERCNPLFRFNSLENS